MQLSKLSDFKGWSIEMLEAVKNFTVNFMRDEEGAQIVEYALIITIVSIASIIALSLIAGSQGNPFANFIGRVTTCLTIAPCV